MNMTGMTFKQYFSLGLFAPHTGDKKTLQTQLHWTFRITAALCFIGHGTWGLITKSGWLPFFASQGIEPDLAWKLQPLVGAFDIAQGLDSAVLVQRLVQSEADKRLVNALDQSVIV